MRVTTSKFSVFWGQKFGRCPSCMRLALGLAASGWGVALVRYAVAGAGGSLGVLVLISLLLTGLTAAHVATIAWRQTGRALRAAAGSIERIGPHGALPINRESAPKMSRRQVVALAFRYGGVALAGLVALPSKARASCGDCAAAFGGGYHDCITHFCNNQGQTCCPPGFPYLNHCDCTCYDGNGFDCNSYSNCLYCA